MPKYLVTIEARRESDVTKKIEVEAVNRRHALEKAKQLAAHDLLTDDIGYETVMSRIMHVVPTEAEKAKPQ